MLSDKYYTELHWVFAATLWYVLGGMGGDCIPDSCTPLFEWQASFPLFSLINNMHLKNMEQNWLTIIFDLLSVTHRQEGSHLEKEIKANDWLI